MVEKRDVHTKSENIKWFSEMSNKDIAIAGGKGASLAEMYNFGFPIPPGFAITAQAYQYFINKTGLKDKIMNVLNGLDIEDTEKLEKDAKIIQKMIVEAEMPEDLKEEIIEAYNILDTNKDAIKQAKTAGALAILKNSQEPPFVAVRSSATAEDLADASFAGQQETFLNVKGNTMLIESVKKCIASLFTARAIYYRQKKGFAHDKTYLSVIIQKMIDSEKAGVIFSKNPVAKDGTILLEASFGLGEGVVSGTVKPDTYVIDPDLNNFKIISTFVPMKNVAFVRDSSGKNKIVKLTPEKGKQQVLNNYEIKRLAQYSLQLEEHYKKPQDIEFAIDSTGIYIVQSRPITTLEKKVEKVKEIMGEAILSGLGASPGVGSGIVKIVHRLEDLPKVLKGDVLVTEMTNPDMVVSMQRAAAIITDEGGLTSHAAIVSREMGIPAVVGTNLATKTLKDGQVVTVDGSNGKVYTGKGEAHAVVINPIVPTKTKIKVIVDLPDFAERAAKTHAKAVGLTRIEGIIAESGEHPLKYIKDKKLGDYVNILHEGLRKIAIPFEETWTRTSDIRTDEFRNLDGAPKEVEGNPMLGDHGIRFGVRHPELIKAEVEAIKRVALEFPNKKLGIMMPQVISVSELQLVKKIAHELNVPKNVVIGIMVETPAAVEIIEDLCKEGIAFISFGTNDLTQYTLAIDRNNTACQDLYDEMHPAVLNSISYVIRKCRRYGVETSICGQAGSKEEMARFLVKEGIDSISVNADAAEKVSRVVAEIENSTKIENKGEAYEQRQTTDFRRHEDRRDKIEVNTKVVQEILKKGDEKAIIRHNIVNGVPGDLLGIFDKVEQKAEESIDIEDKILKELGNEDIVKAELKEEPVKIVEDAATNPEEKPDVLLPEAEIKEDVFPQEVVHEIVQEQIKDEIKQAVAEGAVVEDKLEEKTEEQKIEEQSNQENADRTYDSKNEYMPKMAENDAKMNTPQLNDAIPISSDNFEDDDGQDVILDIF